MHMSLNQGVIVGGLNINFRCWQENMFQSLGRFEKSRKTKEMLEGEKGNEQKGNDGEY